MDNVFMLLAVAGFLISCAALIVGSFQVIESRKANDIGDKSLAYSILDGLNDKRARGAITPEFYAAQVANLKRRHPNWFFYETERP